MKAFPRVRSLTAAVVLMAAPAVARADQIDDANRRLLELDERIRTLSAEFRDQPVQQPNAADRRVLDAELLYNLKNYDAAATLCMDVIERYPNTRAADDAVVLLGESLFQARDLVSAKRYFKEAIKKNTDSRKEQSALQRLVEIALRTNDLEDVDVYLSRLERIPPDRLEPSVPYVRAKYLYFRDKPDEALQLFYNIQPNNPYYLQARYFVGTIQVKKGDLGGAATSFDSVLRIQPKNDADKEVQDLARMDIGRIHYERGQFDKAKEAYSSVPRQSKHFAEAMYEATWNSIKAKDFVAAYRSLDVMLLLDPDSPRAPELKILRGNLHLRLANFFLASESFSQTRDEFEPIYRELQANRQRATTDATYYEKLIGKGMEKFDIALFVPPAAVRWVKSEPEVARVLALADDVGALQKDVRDSEEIVVRLERAVNGPGRVGMFPDLASARGRSTEVLYQILDIRRRFVGRLRSMLANHLTGQDRAELDRLGAERAGLEANLTDLPLNATDLRKREERAKGSLQSLDAAASEFNVQLQAMDAQLVAIEQYFIRSKADQRIKPEDLKQPVTEIRSDLTALRTRLESVRTDIAEAVREFGAGGAASSAERTTTVRLLEVMQREQEIYSRARDRASGSDRRELDGLYGVLMRADSTQTKLLELDHRIDAAADKRAATMKEVLSAGKADLAALSGKIGEVLAESQSVGGGLAQAMLGKVTDRFYDLVVQSDVGLVDVSWGIKDQKTQNLSKLINQQKAELKTIEDDFRSLLEEEK